MPIRKLSRDSIERIAAGEVVERPASIVKELLENALDAGALKISVDVGGDGPDRLMVKDDGCGIPKGEIALALERHTTSKIATADELWGLSTYGFRGEALAAAASVSRLTLASRVRGESGYCITSEGGVIGAVKPASIPEGTSVLVERLFYNTPARRKFLKSQRTELSAIYRVVSDASLTHLDVSFELTHGGKPVMTLPAPSEARARLALLFSHDEARNMMHASGTGDNIAVDAYLTMPEHSRATASKLTVIVNGRPVASKGIFAGVMGGYSGRLLRGRYPVGFVSVTVPPQSLDVNVSPTKSVVKFEDEHAVSSAVARIVRDCVASQASPPDAGAVPSSDAAGSGSAGSKPSGHPQPRPSRGFPVGGQSPAGAASEQSRLRRFGLSSATGPLHQDARGTDALWPARILGQAFDSYIVAETGGGIVIVDQHAADERIAFESLLSSYKGRAIPTQRLLEPALVALGSADMAALDGSAQELRSLGFVIEPFGPGQAKVEGVPAVLGRLADGDELRVALDELVSEGLLKGGSSFVDSVLKLVACKAAVKANQPLSEGEMSRILRGLHACDNPQNCPHGRPTHLRLQKGRLERDFLRVA